jgi:hypothetical protein
MRSSLGCCIVGMLAVMLCQSQQGGGLGNVPPLPRPPNPDGTPRPPRPPKPATPKEAPDSVPSSNEAQERQLQWAHEQNLEDTSLLIKLSHELKWELANNDREVLSLATVKKMDEIERLIKKIRARVGKK